MERPEPPLLPWYGDTGGTLWGKPLTQAVPCNGDPPAEEGVPLQEELVQTVHFRGHRVHDGLAVGGAVIKENVQDGVVDEVTQAVDAGQSDSLQVAMGGEKREERELQLGVSVNPTTFLKQNVSSEKD